MCVILFYWRVSCHLACLTNYKFMYINDVNFWCLGLSYTLITEDLSSLTFFIVWNVRTNHQVWSRQLTRHSPAHGKQTQFNFCHSGFQHTSLDSRIVFSLSSLERNNNNNKKNKKKGCCPNCLRTCMDWRMFSGYFRPFAALRNFPPYYAFGWNI